MDPHDHGAWGERLAADGVAAGGDARATRRLLRDALRVVRGRLGEIARQGVQPLLDEAAAQVRPATMAELRARYPGLPDDEIARRLIDRAARTAAAVALTMGGLLAAQEAVAAASAPAPPASGAALGTVGASAIAEVLALFVLEAKLRADLGALAGQRPLTARELASGVLGEVQARGGFARLPGRSLRRAMPEAAARRLAARISRLVPARFARIVIPEVLAPLVGAAVGARLAARQVRGEGRRHWAELRGQPSTIVSWGSPSAASRNGDETPGDFGHPWGGPGGNPALPPPPPS
jgi:hypothetical protein